MLQQFKFLRKIHNTCEKKRSYFGFLSCSLRRTWNKKDLPVCFGAVKQTTSIPMNTDILANIQHAKIRLAVWFSVDQNQYFLAKSNRVHVWHQKKKAYIVFWVLRVVFGPRVVLWTLSGLCTFEIEFAASCTSTETFFLEDERLIDWALSSMGTTSIYENTTVREEHISDNLCLESLRTKYLLIF
jgi:hypothetical protein